MASSDALATVGSNCEFPAEYVAECRLDELQNTG